MTQRLTDLQVNRVSLVDKGANARVMAILKRQADPPSTPEAGDGGLVGLLRKAADAINVRLQPVPITKASTFAEVIAGQELSDALYDSWYTLQDVLWSAIYAVDENGQALTLEAKTALVAQDLDEFKAFLLEQMNSSVAKRDDGTPSQHLLQALVRKVGKKISGSRLERLQSAAETLNSVLAEVADVVESEQAQEAEETDVEKTELVSAITEAVEKGQAPLVARIEALEKLAKAANPEEEPVTLETVVTVVEKLADRLEALEGGQSVRKSLEGQDGEGTKVKKSIWTGVM